MTVGRLLGLGSFPLVLAACGPDRPAPASAADSAPVVVTVVESYLTERDSALDIDSPAVWHGPDGQHWMLVTAKQGHLIRVADASNGTFIRDVGQLGDKPGEFNRPNGIAVVDDLLFVVERDNRRVQVLALPAFEPVGSYGAEDLGKPYGITIRRNGPGDYDTWISDNYELVEDQVPPDSALGRRVRQYRVFRSSEGLRVEPVRAFGDTTGPGVLRVVESLMADIALGRLLIAEELEGESQVKVYRLDGTFAGAAIPPRFFPHQAEGIALYACGNREGYWITTDQGTEVNTFHVFERASLSHLGSFRGPRTLNTDGIALTQAAVPGFPSGILFAVHDDGNVAAFDWSRVAEALGLRADCSQPSRH